MICATCQPEIERLQRELHLTRLEVADGPRARVIELEATIAAQASVIARLNDQLHSRGRQKPQMCTACRTSLRDCDEGIRAGHVACCSRCRWTDTHHAKENR